jgi:hypothetical protein
MNNTTYCPRAINHALLQSSASFCNSGGGSVASGGGWALSTSQTRRGKSRWRKLVGKLNKAIALAWQGQWQRVGAVARSTQAWSKPVETPDEDRAGWLRATQGKRHEARAKKRARFRPMLRGRHTGSLVTVTTADGRLHVRPGTV